MAEHDEPVAGTGPGSPHADVPDDPARPYTVHDDAGTPAPTPGPSLEKADGTGAHDPDQPGEADAPSTRRMVDPVALVAGLLALLVATLGLTDTLGGTDPRWVFAAGAIGLGAMVLLATLRRRRT